MSAMADLHNDMQAAQALMDNQQDDLTIVYMWAAKQTEEKYKARIAELEQALHEIASNNFLHLTWQSTAPMPLERYKENCDAMVKIARAALGEKKDGSD